MKLTQINERHYKLKKGNRVVVEFIKCRNQKWSAVCGNIGVVIDKETLEECMMKYDSQIVYMNSELMKKFI